MADFDPAMRRLLDALDEPALVVAGETVEVANARARALFGQAIEGGDVRLAVRQPQVLERLLSGENGDVEVSGIGGFERPWTLSIRTLDGGALFVRFVDRSAAIAAERMRVDFVANASHELRTPLSTVVGYAETLADEGELEPGLRRRFAGLIGSEARRMMVLIDDLLNLSRIAADRFVAPTESVDLAAIVREAVALTEDHGCRVATAIDGDVLQVIGDAGQLRQLADNLLSNARRYGCSEPGCAIRVSLERDGRSVRLAVADDGPGIAPDHLPRLTERFYRVDAARSRASGGTGLGLAIVKHIVERHRGTLDIRSAPGAGTEVVVRIPAAG